MQINSYAAPQRSEAITLSVANNNSRQSRLHEIDTMTHYRCHHDDHTTDSNISRAMFSDNNMPTFSPTCESIEPFALQTPALSMLLLLIC
jgi:phosphodiesterase/alkaline phosphatase D-like protein